MRISTRSGILLSALCYSVSAARTFENGTISRNARQLSNARERESHKWNEHLLQALNAALDRLYTNDGTDIQREIWKKFLYEDDIPSSYIPRHDENHKVDFPEHIQGSLKRALDTGVLWWGTSLSLPPFNGFGARREPWGFEIDLLRILTLKIWYHYKEIYRHIPPLQAMVVESPLKSAEDMFRRDEMDVYIGMISSTTAREQRYLFSNPYFLSGQFVILTRYDKDYASLNNTHRFRADTRGLAEWDRESVSIGVIESEVHLTFYESLFSKACPEKFDTIPSLIRDLLEGGVDAVVTDMYIGYSQATFYRLLAVSVDVFGEMDENIALALWRE